jgi:hypothetical protein
MILQYYYIVTFFLPTGLDALILFAIHLNIYTNSNYLFDVYKLCKNELYKFFSQLTYNNTFCWVH